MRWIRFAFLRSYKTGVIKTEGYKYSSVSLRHQICIFSVEKLIIVSLFIMKLLLHLLMLWLFSGGSAEVVDDFEKKCGDFFAIQKSPTRFNGSDYKQICQTLNGVRYYATFYDTDKRIPVYSAYRFEGHKKCDRSNKWYIEPQLDNSGEISSMALEEHFVDETLLGLHQALNGDYLNSGYHKGHLAPVYQANSPNCALATFTLTNAAPQNPSFNLGGWRVVEKRVADYLVAQCLPKTNFTYIVTGVVPSTGNLMKDKVNVPSHFWTAFCCLDQNKKCSISGGFIGENKEKLTVKRKTVEVLEIKLTALYGSKFELFDISTKPKKKIRRDN